MLIWQPCFISWFFIPFFTFGSVFVSSSLVLGLFKCKSLGTRLLRTRALCVVHACTCSWLCCIITTPCMNIAHTTGVLSLALHSFCEGRVYMYMYMYSVCTLKYREFLFIYTSKTSSIQWLYAYWTTTTYMYMYMYLNGHFIVCISLLSQVHNYDDSTNVDWR